VWGLLSRNILAWLDFSLDGPENRPIKQVAMVRIQNNTLSLTSLLEPNLRYSENSPYQQACFFFERGIAMRTVLLWTMLGICLVGCATTPAQMYRPRNYDGVAWKIECAGQMGLIDMPFQIKVNGQTVIDGKFSGFQRHAEYSGTYQGYKITASLTRMYRNIQVLVFVDGERAATF